MSVDINPHHYTNMNFYFSQLKPAEKTFCRSEDGSAGGGWGEECRAVRAKSAQPRRLLVQSRTPQKSFVFLLEEEIRRAQIRNREQNFSVVWRASASGGGAVQSFRSKWVRAKFRIEHQMKLPRFLGEVASPLRGSAWWLCALRKAIKSHGAENEKEADLSKS